MFQLVSNRMEYALSKGLDHFGHLAQKEARNVARGEESMFFAFCALELLVVFSEIYLRGFFIFTQDAVASQTLKRNCGGKLVKPAYWPSVSI